MPKHTETTAAPDPQKKPRTARDPVMPRGLRRERAGPYVGVSPSKFDDWVERKIMPEPIRIDGITVWDRHQLDAAFDDLSNPVEDVVWAD